MQEEIILSLNGELLFETWSFKPVSAHCVSSVTLTVLLCSSHPPAAVPGDTTTAVAAST